MKTKFVYICSAMSLILGLNAHALAPKDFAGTYQLSLENSERNNTKLFCYKALTVTFKKNQAQLYRSDSGSYGGPLYEAPVNGPSRENNSSHGEGMSSSKGADKVSFVKDVLAFEYSGVDSVFGLPMTRTSDSVAMKLSADKKTLTVLRGQFSGLVKGVGQKDKITCIYQKQ